MLPMRVMQRVNGGHPFDSALSRWTRDWDSFFGEMNETGIRVDVRQDGDDLVIHADVPGLSREDIDITVENNVLTVSGSYNKESEEENARYHIRERRHGSFSRSFRLPQSADGEKVEASLTNGVLTLRVPTREEAKPRKIEVK
jgi:HSP20 family protein